MNSPDVRPRFPFVFTLAAAFGVLVLTLNAQAQTAISQTQAPTAQAPWWELIGGFEGDTHDTGYAFFGPSYVHPVNPGVAWTASVFPNYLYYEFDGVAGTTDVHSPGVGSMVGLRFGEKNFFQIAAGPEVKWRTEDLHATNGGVTSVTETRVGADAGALVYLNPSARSNVQAQVNYSTADKYTWGRIGVKGQLNNIDWQGPHTMFLGVEGIGQGNLDIESVQAGGFIEVVHVPTNVSLAFKVGYKRSMFPVGPDKTGPYFAVTFYKRLK